jgi:hypothetical protein
VQLKGKAEPLPVFALQCLYHKRALRLQEPAFALPMVGREAEMAVLAVLADEADSRKGGPGEGFVIQGSRTK